MNAAAILTVDAPGALDRLFEPGQGFGEVRFAPGSPAASLAPSINAAYHACGCELARWSALGGLAALGLPAWWLLPSAGLPALWHWAILAAIALAGFILAGLIGERVGIHRARLQLRRLVDEAERLMDDAARPQTL